MRFRLDRMLLREFIPILIYSFLFCILLLQLVELFEHVVSYVDRGVPANAIVRQQLLYLPQSTVYALPLSLLFSISFSMGSLYSNNELIAVFGAGRRLGRFLVPILVIGMLSGGFLFWFEDAVVIETRRVKEAEQRSLLGSGFAGRTNTTVSSDGGRLVFFTEYYARASDTMDRVTVVERGDEGELERRITARRGVWNGSSWDLEDAIIFEWTGNGEVRSSRRSFYENPDYSVEPEVFRRGSQNVEDMRREEAREFVRRRMETGLPYRQAQTEYLNRYAFAMTPLIVSLMAGAVGSRLKKSILLLSILIAMSLAVFYYGFQFVSNMLARFGYIEPELGAFLPVGLFLLCAIALLQRARS